MDDTTMDIEIQINTYKQLLNQTDYKALKHADGSITDEEYAETRAARQSYRDAINALERQILKQQIIASLGSRPSKAQLLEAAEALGIEVPENATNPEIFELIEAA